MRPMEPAGFAQVDHTADVGLRVWAPTLAGLFEQAARGVVTLLLADPDRLRAERTEEITIDAADIEEALVAWLQEILYRFEVRRFAPARIEVIEAGPLRVTARVAGESVDPARHEPRMDVKAATYHDLRIRRGREPDGRERWETTIIFDI